MEVSEHFQEMRFKNDEQREKLKKSIDDISLALNFFGLDKYLPIKLKRKKTKKR